GRCLTRLSFPTRRSSDLFEGLSPEEIEEMNRLNDEEHQKQAEAFRAGYEKGICYLCNKPFKTISKDSPCLHWLLRQCKFKKKDLDRKSTRLNSSHVKISY